MIGLNKPVWDLGELLLDPQKLFVLWTIKARFCVGLDDFHSHYGPDFPISELVGELRREGFLHQNVDELVLTDTGEQAIGCLGSITIEEIANRQWAVTKKTETYETGDACDVILLAGAGSSCHLGLPTLEDLLLQAVIGDDDVAVRIRSTRESIKAKPTRFGEAVFEELIFRIKQYLAITHLLRTDHTFRGEAGHLPYDIDNGNLETKWKNTLARCYRILLKEYGPGKIDPKSKEFAVTVELLRALAEINDGQIHVYTTNYDCSFQVLAANSQELAFYTHIDSNDGKFTESWHCGNPFAEHRAGKVYVHRLHGCVGWFNDAADQTSNLGSTVKEVYGAGSALKIEDDNYLNQMCIKLIASQLMGTNIAFATAFDEFSSHLRRAKLLLVWGYSFRDLEVIRAINHVFSEQRQSPLRVLYLDPYLPEGTARETIEHTLLQAPIHPATELRPRRIEWTPPDNLSTLVPAITEAIRRSDSI